MQPVITLYILYPCDGFQFFDNFPDAPPGVISRTVDLMIPFQRKDYYVKEMCGRHSIKNVLPALVPDLRYDDLEIGDGEMAMLSYAKLNRTSNMFEIADIRKNLLAYCRLDTLGMVRIWEKLREVAEND